MKNILSLKMFAIFLGGYSSGLPLLIIGSTLQAWMVDEGVDLSSIGLFSLVGLPYVAKFLWAPLLDRYKLPFSSRRKGWIYFFQLLLTLAIFALSMIEPQSQLHLLALISFGISFLSASQDIVLDAYRREILTDDELGLGSSLFITGYRLAMLVSGAFALFMADSLEWKEVYQILALLMLLAMLFTFISPAEQGESTSPSSLKEAVLGPLQDFFARKEAWTILIFILLYKVGDSMASNMIVPFILKLGYSKTQYATVGKTFGMFATIFGGILGGLMMFRISLKKSLIFFGILQALSTLGFSFLSSLPMHFFSLALVIAFENLASGMGTAAYSAFMASLTNKQFTATQYALLTALMGIPRVILSSPTGYMVEAIGWELFFVVCTFVAVPGLILLPKVFQLSSHQSTS